MYAEVAQRFRCVDEAPLDEVQSDGCGMPAVRTTDCLEGITVY